MKQYFHMNSPFRYLLVDIRLFSATLRWLYSILVLKGHHNWAVRLDEHFCCVFKTLFLRVFDALGFSPWYFTFYQHFWCAFGALASVTGCLQQHSLTFPGQKNALLQKHLCEPLKDMGFGLQALGGAFYKHFNSWELPEWMGPKWLY